ncbi:hypothetical protein JCM14076_06480 [Methylosoma difficile]
MSFATRTDLLKRANATRLVQLTVPTDREMVDEAALRLAIDDGDLTGYSNTDQETIALALDAIDGALADADALMLGYSIPATVQTPLLARLAATVALYYLQSQGNMTDDVQKAYDSTIKMFDSHKKGVLSLVPPEPEVTVDDVFLGAEIASSPSRYN